MKGEGAMDYNTTIIIILILLLPTMFLMGFLVKKETYKPFAIRMIQATRNGNTWEFKYPFDVSVDTNYIFLVDFPKGQDNQ
jgi:hypothetical protein